MKIGILSDLHVDLEHESPETVPRALAQVVRETEVAALIVAGDVANDYRLTLATLRALEAEGGARVLFVPGNHDIWNEHHPQLDSWQIYEALKAFGGNLAHGPAGLAGPWVAVGDIGWYDYAFGDPAYGREDFDRMQIGARLWQDKVKAVWGRSTLEVHDFFYRRIERQLADCRGKKIVMVTHVLPVAEFTVQPPDATWGYLNAFLGSRALGELALAHRVAYAVCGHVHYRKQLARGGTRFICNCLNYASQWQCPGDAPAEVRRAFQTIRLD